MELINTNIKNKVELKTTLKNREKEYIMTVNNIIYNPNMKNSVIVEIGGKYFIAKDETITVDLENLKEYKGKIFKGWRTAKYDYEFAVWGLKRK
jgi:phage pi2 protein 07